MNTTVKIGNREIGEGNAAYIVAEIGINHNGDMELAHRTIRAAKKAGADAVKFQNYRTEDFIIDRNITHTYVSNGKKVTESQYEMFKRYELQDEQLAKLAEFCRDTGIDFHSTPTNKEGVALLQSLGVGVFKNGSDYLGNLPLIEAMGETGLPVVLSTGMATVSEIDDAVRTVRATGNDKIVLLYCVSQYPAPLEEIHLGNISLFRNRFHCLIGFSDHTENNLASVIAVSQGACWIEKHFTLDRNLPGPDHAFSANPEKLEGLVGAVRNAEKMLRYQDYEHLSEQEMKSRLNYKLSCSAAGDLPAGTILTVADIAFFRPGTGIPPAEYKSLIGRRLNVSLTHGQIIKPQYLDE